MLKLWISQGKIAEIAETYVRSDTMKPQHLVLNSYLMRPDSPHNKEWDWPDWNFILLRPDVAMSQPYWMSQFGKV